MSLPRYNTDSSEKELWPTFTEASWPRAKLTDSINTMKVRTIKKDPRRFIQCLPKSTRLFVMTFFRLKRAVDLFRGNRQIHDLNANGVIQRVCNGCGCGDGPMLSDGLGLKGARPFFVSDIQRLMSRDILDVRKFVFAEIVRKNFSVFIGEIFH